MEIKLNKRPAGIVLVVALFVIVVAGVVIGSYLALMQGESRIVSRSQLWNQCVPVMEAGVEEALAQIQYCGFTNNFSGNNWTAGSNGYFQKTRTNSLDGSYWTASITPGNPPVVYSTGFVPVPQTSEFVSRQVMVTTKPSPAAPGGLTAKGQITFGGGAILDSYDSSVAPYNPAMPGTNAQALTDAGITGAITLGGNSLIYGTAATAPYGTIIVGNNAAIGDATWCAGSAGIETGWSANDAHVQIDDVMLPTNTASWIQNVTNGKGPDGTNYANLLENANYKYTGDLGGIFGVFGNCTLYITGNLDLGPSDMIYIATNSSLTIYLAGSASIKAPTINSTMIPANFHLHGLPTCTLLKFTSGPNFYGVVDAPEATLQFSGGGNAYGSFIVNMVSFTGNGGIHYDVSLGRPQHYLMASWNEL